MISKWTDRTGLNNRWKSDSLLDSMAWNISDSTHMWLLCYVLNHQFHLVKEGLVEMLLLWTDCNWWQRPFFKEWRGEIASLLCRWSSVHFLTNFVVFLSIVTDQCFCQRFATFAVSRTRRNFCIDVRWSPWWKRWNTHLHNPFSRLRKRKKKNILLIAPNTSSFNLCTRNHSRAHQTNETSPEASKDKIWYRNKRDNEPPNCPSSTFSSSLWQYECWIKNFFSSSTRNQLETRCQ